MTGLWLLAGGLVGALNSLSLWWTVAQFRADAPAGTLLLTVGGMTLRLALVTALLIGGLQQGIVPGLLAFAGLWLVRSASVVCFHTSDVLRPWATAGGNRSSPERRHRG